ncbi:hypothetical protein KG007_00590 [Alistipes sp. kh20]|uniref:hypothetical protein n=1 Tax=Alistipes montrealensis TaxID=2834113 RepID=UPI001BCBE882|nr:hypothetical protein [Alistipes montrealensis]MBS4764704.1 hypothetical protein [Alistipes montrealensis]
MQDRTGDKDATDRPLGTIEQFLFDTGTEINFIKLEGFINPQKIGVRFLLEKEDPTNGITREFIVIAMVVKVPDAGINWPNVGVESGRIGLNRSVGHTEAV